MRKLICAILLILFSFLTGCGGDNTKHIGLKELGIDKTKGQLIEYIDTHGSLGEGCTFVELEFRGENAKDTDNVLPGNDKWNRLPLPAKLQKAVYGDETNASLLRMFEEETPSIPAIPAISHGFYYFYDRHEESTDRSDASCLFIRGSFHFDILLYDMDKHVLYIFQLDT